jgi:hypothetical protein
MRRSAMLAAVALTGLSGTPVFAQSIGQDFLTPPADARPMVRWWWFGPAVEDKEIVREIRAMSAGGFGGFEIQSVYPLTTEGNTPFLSETFLKTVKLANDTGRTEGLRVDVTLGSGWPFGGPHIPVTEAAAHIRLTEIAIGPDVTSIDLPALSAGELWVAAFVGSDIASATLLDPLGSRLTLTASALPRTVFLIIQSPTGQQVKRASLGAEGNVLDHMSESAVQTHIHAVGDRLLSAFGDTPPYSVFSDSLEVYGADWTTDLLAEFQKRRGYDLKPHLLELFHDTGTSAAVRHDWGQTLSDLTEARYLTPLNEWARAHNTRFRSQTYGFPPVTLSSNRLAALPEGEGPQWRQFSTTRWASSANHLYGNTVTSAESWTWLHHGAFQATPLDIKAEADLLVLEGVNQFIAHGWPYSPPDAAEPGWALYAAAVFNDHNPWWGVMPDINLYLQRVSYLMRQGTPVADVAILLPQDDAFAAITPGEATVSGQMDKYVTPGLTTEILNAGYSFDYIDSEAIRRTGLKYKVLILPRVSRIAPETYAQIAEFARQGGIVLAIDHAPDLGPGLLDAEAHAKAVREFSAFLFPVGSSRLISEPDLGKTLAGLITPDLTGAPPEIGFVHRKLAAGDLYYIANTSNQPISAPLHFHTQDARAQMWDPRTGGVQTWDGGSVNLSPYESKVFVFGDDAHLPAPVKASHTGRRELATGWSLTFPDRQTTAIQAFSSWTTLPAEVHFSGVATYSVTIDLSRNDIASGLTVLDFGAGTPIEAPPGKQNGTQALLLPPIREAAEIYVNGRRAGSVWTAPFTINIKPFVRRGRNRIEVRVSNTAVNALAGHPATNYGPLTAKYGERFQPQNMDSLVPLPSGILRTPALTTSE